MEISINFTNMMEDTIGSEHGISEEEIKKLKPKVREIDAQLKEQREKGALPFLNLPYQDDLVKELKALSEEQKGLWDNLVVLGIGGSALGGIALHRGLHHFEEDAVYSIAAPHRLVPGLDVYITCAFSYGVTDDVIYEFDDGRLAGHSLEVFGFFFFILYDFHVGHIADDVVEVVVHLVNLLQGFANGLYVFSA